jgi:hypothetical protein
VVIELEILTRGITHWYNINQYNYTLGYNVRGFSMRVPGLSLRVYWRAG